MGLNSWKSTVSFHLPNGVLHARNQAAFKAVGPYLYMECGFKIDRDLNAALNLGKQGN